MKFSQYNVITKCKDGIIIFNLRTSKYVKIKEEKDISHFEKLYGGELPLSIDDDMVKPLVERGYIVEDNVDEYAEARNDLEKFLEPYKETFKVIIYVTEQCNFRCIYCPEEHINKRFSDKNWEALYKHIENGVKNKKYNKLDISFFGGEPLLEYEKILPFIEKLHNLKKDNPDLYVRNIFVTNGYLLTPEVYDELTKNDTEFFQITVDGFAENHNKTRPLAGGQPSWDKIIENLKYINSKNDNIKITIRANYNDSNIDSLKEYDKWVRKTFDNPKISFDYYPVSDFSEKVPKELVNNNSSEKSLEVQEDLSKGDIILKPYIGICNSGYPNYFAISADGDIAVCENISGGNKDLYVGYLAENGDFVLNEKYQDWTTDFELEACEKCVIYPLCCARTCPSKKVFSPTRDDCKHMQEFYEDRILHYIQNKL